MKLSTQCLLLIGLFFAVSFSVKAAKVDNLYQTDVATTATNWQQLALEQVLVRVSGKADITENLAIKAELELKQASAYIKQFTAVRENGEDITRVLLDSARVNQLLQQNNIAVWGELRPDTLIWLVQQEASERRFIRNADNGLLDHLKFAFNQAALPYLLPLYDMDDLTQISESDVWAGFWQQINQASARYNTDVIIAATIDNVTAGNNLLWRLTWQRQHEGRIIREQVTAEEEATLMQSFARSLAEHLAEQYASVLSVQSTNNVIIEVANLTSLTDLVTVQQLLQQLVGVTQVTITSFSDDKARYSLQTAIASQGLLNALQFNNQFKLQTTELAIDSRAMPALATFRYVRP